MRGPDSLTGGALREEGGAVHATGSRPAWLGALLICLVLGGCAPDRAADLLSVGAVGPAWIEPGVEVWLTGEGLPVGRTPRVRFRGRVHQPGMAPRVVEVQAEGQVVSAERIRLVVSERLVRAMGGRGTFEGHVRVELDGAPGFGVVFGSTPEVSLDFAATGRDALADDMARARDARAWLREVGVTLDEDAHAEGLAVAEVTPDGPAAAAGVRGGDVLAWADGVTLHVLGDLGGGSGEGPRHLRARRSGVEGVVKLAVMPPVPATRGPGGMAWWVAALLVLLAWFGPAARVFDGVAWALARRISRPPRLRDLPALALAVVAAVATLALSPVARPPLLALTVAVASFGLFGGVPGRPPHPGLALLARPLGAAWLAHLLVQPWVPFPTVLWAAPALAVLLAGVGAALVPRPATPTAVRWAPLLAALVGPLVAVGWLLVEVPRAPVALLTPGLLATAASVILVALHRAVALRRRGTPRPPEPRLLVVP
jgi:hypothetical protein